MLEAAFSAVSHRRGEKADARLTVAYKNYLSGTFSSHLSSKKLRMVHVVVLFSFHPDNNPMK